MDSAPPTEISQLKDLVPPEAAGLWPFAPGWYWVGAILLVGVTVFAWRAWARWKANAYRREALALLNGPDVSIGSLFEVLKRVAITTYGREVAAGLSGDAWIQFLQSTGDGLDLAPIERAYAGVYGGSNQDSASREALLESARNWILHHEEERRRT